MPLTLRTPLLEDFEALAAWIPDAESCRRWAGPRLDYPFLAADLPTRLAQPGGELLCLAEGNGSPVAFGQYWVIEEGAVHLGRIIVAPEARGRGIGRELCQQLMNRAITTTGASSVTLRVVRQNTVAAALYESLGFVPATEDPGSEVILMRRPARP